MTADEVTLRFRVTDTGIGIAAGQTVGHLRRLRASRCVDDEAIRRHRPRPDDFRAARRDDGWADLDRKRARQGQPLPLFARFGIDHDARTLRCVSADALHDLHVLIVDDNATNRLILSEMLAGWRMRAVAVDGAAGAMTALREAVDRGDRTAWC